MMQANQLQLPQTSPLNITSIITFMHIILLTLVRQVFLVQLVVISGETLCFNFTAQLLVACRHRSSLVSDNHSSSPHFKNCISGVASRLFHGILFVVQL